MKKTIALPVNFNSADVNSATIWQKFSKNSADSGSAKSSAYRSSANIQQKVSIQANV
jgi:hypothetical protein